MKEVNGGEDMEHREEKKRKRKRRGERVQLKK